MPIDYRIDPERRLVLSRAWGVLTDDDILGLKERLVRDDAFDPTMPQLSDVSAIEGLEVTTGGVQAMVTHDRDNADRVAGQRLALVVPSDAAFGMARMYQMLNDRGAEHIGVFRCIAEAEEWLQRGHTAKA